MRPSCSKNRAARKRAMSPKAAARRRPGKAMSAGRQAPSRTGPRRREAISTQGVFELKEKIAKRYKLAHDKVRVIADHVGGGFGSKGNLGMETVAAIELARAAKAPVRIAYDRHEELSVTGYPPAAAREIALFPPEQRIRQ